MATCHAYRRARASSDTGDDAVLMITDHTIELFPESSSAPYYIVSPPYTRFSAGVKALHLLCHHLNMRGYQAYFIPIENSKNFTREDLTEPDFLTPVLNRRTAQKHFDTGRTPITVYPEIIPGNPYDSPCVTRYVLNFPGQLGGNQTFEAHELCFSYSKALAASTRFPDNVLFIPASDTRIFHPPTTPVERKGSCFYASKYQKTHGGKLFDITKNSLEITSGQPDSQSPEEVAQLFYKSEIFYTYENTALAIEAGLCGCPVVFLPNEHLCTIIGAEEFKGAGFAWGDAPEAVAKAKETSKFVFENYKKLVSEFHADLDRFITTTQEHSMDKIYTAEQAKSLTSKLPIRDVKTKEKSYALLFNKLPWWIEREAGSLLCTLGLHEDGEFLWNRATRRSQKIV